MQTFTYDPHTNNLELNAIRVIRQDGTVEEVPLDSRIDQPQPSYLLYWGSKQYVVSVPRLFVGDAVETIHTLTGFNVAYLAAEDSGVSGGAPKNALGEELQPPVPDIGTTKCISGRACR